MSYNRSVSLLKCVVVAVFFSGTVGFAQEGSTSYYQNNLKLREDRKVGVGLQAGGLAGVLGAVIELNIENQNGTIVTAGLGSEYSTFALAWKHSFEGRYTTPYATLGWSRWYNSTSKEPTGSHVLNSVLDESEKNSGQFGIDFIAAGAGLQYQELGGDFEGTSLFVELNLLASTSRGKLIPTFAIGSTYYF